jgi:glutamate--cysteine ligase
MELSTQLLLREAVKRGVHFDILDRRENFVRLHKLGKEEYVMQATRTSLDRYSNVLLMNNKLTTKLVLARAGIRVPEGFHFTSMEDAFPVGMPFRAGRGGETEIHQLRHRDHDIEREPESRGLPEGGAGSIQEDQDILVEYFVSRKGIPFLSDRKSGSRHPSPGASQRHGRWRSHHRGTGQHQESRSPAREGLPHPAGENSTRETEIWFLGSQGLHVGSIPGNGERVFLRENSNISTGGDSIDMTERIHGSYHEMASRASRALGGADHGS